MSKWFISRQGKLTGPHTLSQLQAMVKSGELKPTDQICPDGGAPTMAKRVPGLFASEPAVVKAASPKVAPPPVKAAPPPVERGPQPKKPAKSSRPEKPVAADKPWSLPKPVLFALCGAVGGLVAALLMGELAWYLAQPQLVRNQPGIRLAAPESMSIYTGGKQRFKVKIGRDFWKGPASLELQDAAAGIHAASVTLPTGEGEAEAELELHVDRAVAAGAHSVGIAARGQAADGSTPSARQQIDLRVLNVPASLAMEASPEVEVYQGGRNRFRVRVARSDFDGDITVRLQDPPAGVSLLPVTIPAAASETEVELAVAKDVPVGSRPITLHAESFDRGKSIAASKNSWLTVRPSPRPMADVLFVLDLTGSMAFAIHGIKSGIGDFAEKLQSNNIDFQIGLIGFRDIEADREEPFNLLSGTFTKDPDILRNALTSLQARGGGFDPPESSLQALEIASRQSFRRGATRVLLLITDAAPKIHRKISRPPYSVGETCDILKAAQIDQLHLVVRPADYNGFGLFADKRNPYRSFHKSYNSQGFAGEYFDITKVNKDGANFARILPDLGRSISTLTKATTPPAPPVKAPPALPASAGRALLPPPTELRGLPAVSSTGAYAEENRGRLVFAIALWTTIIAAGISLVISLGQQFYLRKKGVQIAAWSKAIAGGILAGLIGGAAGQLFVQGTAGGAAWDILSRVIGWGMLGSLAGLGMAFVVPNLKYPRGLLGGLVGGVLGAFAFLIISFASRGLLGAFGEAFGRLAGATVLGFCIGLMVALAELAFRQRWLEVTFGAREIRTVTLGRAAVTVGGDDRRASVHVAGAAPIALEFHVANDAVFCKDVATGVSREVQPGTKYRLGNVTVAVCTSTTARQSGYTLDLDSGAAIPLGVGMPLTAADLPGLEPQGADGMVALVSPQPSDPAKLLLRNRSRQSWKATDANGATSAIDPGRGIELTKDLTIDFGPVRGTIVHD